MQGDATEVGGSRRHASATREVPRCCRHRSYTKSSHPPSLLYTKVWLWLGRQCEKYCSAVHILYISHGRFISWFKSIVCFLCTFPSQHTSTMDPTLSQEPSWYYCKFCRTKDNKPFSAKRGWERHMREQHSDMNRQSPPQHMCPDCGRSFQRASNLKRHLTDRQCNGRNPSTAPSSSSNSSRKRSLDFLGNVFRKRQKAPQTTPLPVPGVFKAQARLSFTESKLCFDLVLSSHDAVDASPRKLDPPSNDGQDTPVTVSSEDGLGTQTVSVPDQSSTSASLALQRTPEEALENSQLNEVVLPDVVDLPPLLDSVYEEGPTRRFRRYSSYDSLDDYIRRCNASQSTQTEVPPSSRSASARRTSRPGNRAVDLLSDSMSSLSLKNGNKSTLSSLSLMYGSKSLFRRRDSEAYQSAKVSGPEIPGPFNTSVDSELREARRQSPYLGSEPERIKSLALFGSRWLRLASLGNGEWASNMMEDREKVDINYKCPYTGKTALMIAIEHGHYHFVHELMSWNVSKGQQWPLLSTRDNDEKTVMDLMSPHKRSNTFTLFMEHVVAITCCSCSDWARRGSICEWIAHTEWADRHGLTLQGPVKYPFRAGCQWGEKLRQRDWLQAETLQEIDDWVVQRTCLATAINQTSMEDEWRIAGRMLYMNGIYQKTWSSSREPVT